MTLYNGQFSILERVFSIEVPQYRICKILEQKYLKYKECSLMQIEKDCHKSSVTYRIHLYSY